jgi:hypothetical protein
MPTALASGALGPSEIHLLVRLSGRKRGSHDLGLPLELVLDGPVALEACSNGGNAFTREDALQEHPPARVREDRDLPPVGGLEVHVPADVTLDERKAGLPEQVGGIVAEVAPRARVEDQHGAGMVPGADHPVPRDGVTKPL